MRLIDADALGICKDKREAVTGPEYADGWNSAIEIIDKAPTIDIDRPTQSQFKHMAVQLGYEPVVHCKDCRLGEPDMIVNGYKDDFWCKYYEHPKPAYGFCEKGERKNNGNEDRA